MTPEQDLTKAIDRMFPEPPPDVTVVTQERLTSLQSQIADAERDHNEVAQAIERCDKDINAPRDVERQISELTAKRTDALAQSYLGRIWNGTSVKALDKQISELQTSLTELKIRAEGAAAARRVLLPQLVAARATLDELQESVSFTSLQMAGRVLSAGEMDSLAHAQRRRQQASMVDTAERSADELRAQRDAAEVERQRRQNGGRDPDPMPWLK
jgi:hypothetical protein